MWRPNRPEGRRIKQRSSRQVGDKQVADRFTADTAAKTGQSERAIQRDAERGERERNCARLSYDLRRRVCCNSEDRLSHSSQIPGRRNNAPTVDVTAGSSTIFGVDSRQIRFVLYCGGLARVHGRKLTTTVYDIDAVRTARQHAATRRPSAC